MQRGGDVIVWETTVTKNSAGKRAARTTAQQTGQRYAAARRLTRNDRAVPVTLHFRGPDAPPPFTADGTWWLSALTPHELAWLRDEGWTYDPSGCVEQAALPEFLSTLASTDSVAASIYDWVAENTREVRTHFEVPDERGTGTLNVQEHSVQYPFTISADPKAARRFTQSSRTP